LPLEEEVDEAEDFSEVAKAARAAVEQFEAEGDGDDDLEGEGEEGDWFDEVDGDEFEADAMDPEELARAAREVVENSSSQLEGDEEETEEEDDYDHGSLEKAMEKVERSSWAGAKNLEDGDENIMLDEFTTTQPTADESTFDDEDDDEFDEDEDDWGDDEFDNIEEPETKSDDDGWGENEDLVDDLENIDFADFISRPLSDGLAKSGGVDEEEEPEEKPELTTDDDEEESIPYLDADPNPFVDIEPSPFVDVEATPVAEKEPPKKDYNKMRIVELKELLRERGMRTTGNKARLVSMLEESDRGGTIGSNKRTTIDVSETMSSGDDGFDFNSLTVPELKDELRKRGLKLAGRKSDLIERLRAAMSSSSS